MAQPGGIVGVFVAGDDLIDALPQQGQRFMAHTVILTRIAQARSQVAGQMMALIESSQREKPGITGDLAAGEVSANGLTVEAETQLWYTSCHVVDAPKGSAGFSQNPAFMLLLEHPFSFCQQNQ